jgi:hypothetical protein
VYIISLEPRLQHFFAKKPSCPLFGKEHYLFVGKASLPKQKIVHPQKLHLKPKKKLAHPQGILRKPFWNLKYP